MKRGIINKTAKITGYSYNTVKKYANITLQEAPNKLLYAEIHATIKAIKS
jgi:hypothetical protein